MIQIGAWNIEWLGNPQKRKSKVAQVPADVADYIRAGRVDVLALEEISITHRGSEDEPRNHILDAALNLLSSNGTVADWKYQLFEKREGARDKNDQWTGLAWNTATVSVAGGPWKLPVQIDQQRETELKAKIPSSNDQTLVLSRWPHAVKFSAGRGLTDFIVVPLHLKSNREGEVVTAIVRGYEVELTLQALKAFMSTASDDDVILLGDTNVLAANEPAIALLTAAEFKDCNSNGSDTYIPQGGAPFDRIFLVARQPETANSCLPRGQGNNSLDFKIIEIKEWKKGATVADFVTKLSDHMMVRFGICVTSDDD